MCLFTFFADLGKFETIVYNISNSGKLVEKYNGVVDLEVAYDPQGISCRITCTGKFPFNTKRTLSFNANTPHHIQRTDNRNGNNCKIVNVVQQHKGR